MVRVPRKTHDKGDIERHASKLARREEREAEELKTTISQLQRELDEVKSTTSDRKQAASGGADAQTVKALAQDLGKQSKQHRRAIAELSEAIGQRDQLKAQVTELEKTIQTDERVKEQARQLKEASTQKNEIAGKLGAVEEECAVYRQRVEQLERGAALAVGKDVQQQKEKLREMEERLRRMENRIVTLEAERDDLQGLVKGGKIRVDLLEKEKARLERDLAQGKGKAEAASPAPSTQEVTARQQAERKLVMAEARADRAETERKSMGDRLARECNKIKTLEKKAQDLQKELDSRPLTNGPSSPELDSLRTELARAKATLTSITAALNLTSADIASLELGGYPNLSVLLTARSVLEVAFSTSAGQEQAEEDIALLTKQLEDAQAQLSADREEQSKAAANAREVITPPHSPQQKRQDDSFGLMVVGAGVVRGLEAKTRSAELARDRQAERAMELERRLIAFENAAMERPASETGTPSNASSSSNARQFAVKLNKDVVKLNQEVIKLRTENVDLLMMLSGV